MDVENEPEPEFEIDIEPEERDLPGNDEPPFPPLYQSGEDYEKAGDLKQEAVDQKSAGNLEAALEKYTEAVLAAPPSSLLYANRAAVLLELNRPLAAERDCTEALIENPDSAKALRIRGKARKIMGQWEAALKDLSQSQTIDFDEGTVEDLKFLTEKRIEQEKSEAAARLVEEERLRKRAEEIKRAREEAKKEEARSSEGAMPGMSGMPGMPGMGGGMPGMPGMADLLSDPELMAELQNPKVMEAFQELMSGPGGPMGLMSNPQKLQELMSDPEVGPVLQKLMAKMMGGAMPGATTGRSADQDDGIPNMDEVQGDVDLDELPDLE
jgi:suppressor of tumorigenicity protein 13